MIDKEQYCIGFDGVLKTKGSEVVGLYDTDLSSSSQ